MIVLKRGYFQIILLKRGYFQIFQNEAIFKFCKKYGLLILVLPLNGTYTESNGL